MKIQICTIERVRVPVTVTAGGTKPCDLKVKGNVIINRPSLDFTFAFEACVDSSKGDLLKMSTVFHKDLLEGSTLPVYLQNASDDLHHRLEEYALKLKNVLDIKDN